jgi:bifunctional UDP-N-acetylglucosamine pyrophosphorylase/glucosamine-1-phosphate N-acetyltransferase
MNEHLAAVVLCAGKGTRMKSETAKVLHPSSVSPWRRGRWAARWRSAAIRWWRWWVTRGGVRIALEARFLGQPLRFATQVEQRGTADAVRAALGMLDGVSGPILVLYGDTPLLREATLRALVDTFRRGTAPLALVSTVAPDPSGYGRVIRVSGRITGIVEEKDATPAQRRVREVNAGLYCADAAFLWKALAKVDSKNAQNEFYLTDLVALAARRGGSGRSAPSSRTPPG